MPKIVIKMSVTRFFVTAKNSHTKVTFSKYITFQADYWKHKAPLWLFLTATIVEFATAKNSHNGESLWLSVAITNIRIVTVVGSHNKQSYPKIWLFLAVINEICVIIFGSHNFSHIIVTVWGNH